MNNITNVFRGLAALLLAALFTVNCAWAQEEPQEPTEPTTPTAFLNVDPNDANTYILSGYGEYTSPIDLSGYTLTVNADAGETITCTQNVSVNNFSVTSGKVAFSQNLTIASGQTVNWNYSNSSLGGTLYLDNSTLAAETVDTGFFGKYFDIPNNIYVTGDCLIQAGNAKLPYGTRTIEGNGNVTFDLANQSGYTSSPNQWIIDPKYSGTTTIIQGPVGFDHNITLYDLSAPYDKETLGSYLVQKVNVEDQSLELVIKEGSFYHGQIQLMGASFMKIRKDANAAEDASLKMLCEAAGAEGIHAESVFLCSGRLDYKGVMSASLTVGDAEDQGPAFFSPGNSVGEATVNGVFTIDNDAFLVIEQDATGIDRLVVNEFSTENDNWKLKVVTNGVAPGAEYTIIDVLGDGLTGDQLNDSYWNGHLFEDLPEYMTLSVKGNSVVLTLDRNMVPEPSTWALLVLGAAGLLYWRKRKN